MWGWVKQMRSSFGASFLWLVSFIYFTQGFRSFVWTAVSYQLKDMLKLSPSASQFVNSVAFFPWSIKPLYGILSDCIPIRGKKRVPYLLIATVLSLFPWFALGIAASLRGSLIYLTILLILQNLGSAMADVVIDAMIAEAVRSERIGLAGDLQSLSWSAMAMGGICGSLLGGYALSNFRIETIFLNFSLLPTIQLISCVLVEEVPLGSEGAGSAAGIMDYGRNDYLSELQEEGVSNMLGKNKHGNVQNKIDMSSISGNSSAVEILNPSTLRKRKGSQKNGKRKATNSMPKIMEVQHKALFKRWFASLKSALYSLGHAFRQPTILRPMAWFFLSHITVPNLSTVMFYYQTEVLHLEASFLGTARVIGWFGLMLGTYAYNRYLKYMRLRSILLWAHVGLAMLNLIDVVLVSRSNIQFGVSDKFMVLFGSALGDAINQFKMMPFLILSGRLCPPGVEGTLFALFMSINNLGSTLSSFLGAALASFLNISAVSFDNLLFGIVVQLICTFIPIALLFLIPKETTGLSA